MNKRKLRFNAVDAILLLVLAVAVFAVLYIFVFSADNSQTAETNEKMIRYTILVQNLDEHYNDAVKVGSPVTDGVEKKSIGTVIGVQDSPMKKITFDYENGREVEASVEGKINLKITIEAKAVDTERALTVGGLVIKVGEQYSLMLPDFYCTGFCIDISDDQQT